MKVPQLVLQVVHGAGGKVGELVSAWSQTLAEMPPITDTAFRAEPTGK